MASTDPIVWNEGMILTPQHLQQNDLRFEKLMNIVGRLTSPYPWGFFGLAIDETALPNGEIVINRALGVFPGGFVFDYDAQIDPPLRAALPVEGAREGTRIPIYLALRRPAVSGVLVSGTDGRLIFGEENQPLDVLTGEQSGQVGRLRPQMTLMFSRDQVDRFELLQVARLRFRGGVFSAEPYIPPMLILDSRHPIHRQCVLLTNTLREKAAVLGESLGTSGVGRDVKADTHRRIFEAVFRELPPLEARLELPECFPYELYFDLCRLTAAIVTTVQAQALPTMAYLHEDSLVAFKKLIDSTRAAIDQVEALFLTRPFRQDGSHFQLDAVDISDEMVIGLRVNDASYRNEAASWFERAHIGSSSHIEAIVANRIYGAARRRVTTYEPFGISEDSKMALFIIDATPEYITIAEDLHVEGATLTSGLEDISLLMFSQSKRT
jgi:type VI secretion system protein ImpJ